MSTAKSILARREQVKTLTSQGVPASEIADILGVSTRTVDRHRSAPLIPSSAREDEHNAPCFVCGRTVRRKGPNSRFYDIHATEAGGTERCTNSELPTPVTEINSFTHSRRIKQVLGLASVVQDEDPRLIDNYLTGLSAHEVQAVALYALAAIDLDRTRDELFPRWTRELKVGA